MKKIGLTGGIGSGKSYIAKIFEALMVPVFYADDEAKKILNEAEVLQAVSSLLKTNIVDEISGKADRKKIASLVFRNATLLHQLNQIIHPKVEEHFKSWTNQLQHHSYVIKEAAILFESGSYKNLDGVICVVAPIELRIKRVSQRDQADVTEITKRMQNQWSDEERLKYAQWVIHNEENSALLSQVLDIHMALKKI